MEQAGFIACIDFGTSHITGLLGRRNEQDVISIIASESIPSDSSVKYGIVYNIDEAAGKVKKLLSLLENKVGKKIGKVYVSIAGMSLRAVEHIQTKRFAEETLVSYITMDEMETQAKMNRLPLLTTYSVVAPEVFLDSQLEKDAIGKTASVIEIRYRLIAGRPNIKSNLQRAITEKNHIEIAGYIVGPSATGAILLDEEDKNKGCVLVDFGGGTTTVSVYKDGLLRYMTVIPLGGRTITKDIQALGFNFDTAESYKIRFGKAGKERPKPNTETLNTSVDLKELNKVIQLRQEEIILNVINQIKDSGYTNEELEAGIIITGGASQMKGLDSYLSEKAKLPVKAGIIKRLYINNAIDLIQNPSYTQCLGIMLFAKENCEKVEKSPFTYESPLTGNIASNQNNPDKKENDFKDKDDNKNQDKDKNNTKKPKQKSIFDFLQNFGGTLFNGEE